MNQIEFTVAGYILNREHNKILLVHNKKLDFWVPAGGHIESGETASEAVMREIFEETGLKPKFLEIGVNLGLTNYDEVQQPVPYIVLKEIIPAKEDRPQKIFSSAYYILEADEQEVQKQDIELHDARWMTLTEIELCNTYPSVIAVAKRILK